MLVDIRAWDTLGEISVLVAVATGVASLIFVSGRTGGAPRLGDLADVDGPVNRRDRLQPVPEHAASIRAPRTSLAATEGESDAAAEAASTRQTWLLAGRTLSPRNRSILIEVLVPGSRCRCTRSRTGRYLTQALTAAIDNERRLDPAPAGRPVLRPTAGRHLRTNSTVAFYAINCLDSRRSADFDVMRAEAAQIQAAAPTVGSFFGYGGTVCAQWPVPEVGGLDSYAAEGAAPILVVGTTGDPATPYRWAEQLADHPVVGRPPDLRGRGAHRVRLLERLHRRHRRRLPAHRGRPRGGHPLLSLRLPRHVGGRRWPDDSSFATSPHPRRRRTAGAFPAARLGRRRARVPRPGRPDAHRRSPAPRPCRCGAGCRRRDHRRQAPHRTEPAGARRSPRPGHVRRDRRLDARRTRTARTPLRPRSPVRSAGSPAPTGERPGGPGRSVGSPTGRPRSPRTSWRSRRRRRAAALALERRGSARYSKRARRGPWIPTTPP